MGQKQKEEEERLKVGNNNGQLCLANATSGGARKPPGPNISGSHVDHRGGLSGAPSLVGLTYRTKLT